MANSPTPEETPPSQPSRRRRWRRVLLPLGAVALAGFAGGAWWVWVFVHEQLAPLIEKNLSQTVNRPVKLGQVERFTLTSLRFGASEVPATPTDPDRLAIEQIDVTFNPLRVLLQRELVLDITIDKPTLYIEQAKDGTWVSTEISQQEEEGPIKTVIDAVRFRDAEAVLVPWAKYGNQLGKPVTLQDADGEARFFDNNQRVSYELAARSTTGGKLQLAGESLLQTPTQTKLKLQAQNYLLSEVDRLVKLPVDLQSGRVDSQLSLALIGEEDPAFQGTAQFRDVTLQIPNTPTPFRQANGALKLNGTELRLENVKALYGTVPVQANGTIDTEKGYALTAKVPPVPLTKVTESLKLQTPVPVAGEVQADLRVTGEVEQPIISGTARSTKPVQVDRLNFSRVSTQFRLDAIGQKLAISNLALTPVAGGQVTGAGVVNITERPTLTFQARVQDVAVDPIVQSYLGADAPQIALGQLTADIQLSGFADALQSTIPTAQLTLPTGGFVVASGRIAATADPALALNVQAIDVNADPIVRGFVDPALVPFTIGAVNAQARITGPASAPVIDIATARVTPPAGGLVTASGRVGVGAGQPLALDFLALNLPGDAIARAYNNGAALPATIGRVNAQGQVRGTAANPRTVVDFQAPEATYAASGQVVTEGDRVALNNAIVKVGSGTVRANARLAAGRWQAAVNAASVPLGKFSPELRGLFSGDFTLAGTTDFNLADVRAQGQGKFSEGISVIDRPLTAQVRWDGQRVNLQATAVGFSASGDLGADLSGSTPALANFDLAVRLDDYDLAAFEAPLPVEVQYAGRADFDGRIFGTPTAPKVNGNLALRQFVFNQVAFEPLLRGTVRVDNGVDVDLRGTNDRIAVTLDPAFQPIAFAVRQGQSLATGTTQGDQLIVTARDFRAELLGPFAQTELGPVRGKISADLSVHRKTFEISGKASGTSLAIGFYRLDQLATTIEFANGVATLSNTRLRRGESVFEISGSAALTGANPQIKNGKLTVTDGNIQDVLELALIFELEDFQRGLNPPQFGNQSDLPTVPIDFSNTPVIDQLRRLAEVAALLDAQAEQRAEAPIPGLDQLQGRFDATVTVNGALRNPTVDFKVAGENWQWGSYRSRQVLAEGSLKDGNLSLLPVRLQSGDAVISFTGQVSSEELAGQVRLENVPLSGIRDVINSFFPERNAFLTLEGKLDATATLSGSLQNPQAIGSIQLEDATLNGTAVKEARASFQYVDARLGFGSRVFVAAEEPLVLSGSLPVALPFASVKPASDDISLIISVKNEGLALLDLLNNQVSWVGGKGEVQLNVGGTLTAPNATGFVRLDDATFRATALPDELLTNVDALVTLNNTLITVDRLTGDYSQGTIAALGSLPISGTVPSGDPEQSPFVAVKFDNINLRLTGLYRGRVDGQIDVGGSALSPVLGGAVVLSQGEVQLAAQAPAPGAPGAPPASSAGASPIELQNLRLRLGNGLRVTQAPLINFVAQGDLTINGNLDEPLPDGTIRLTGGQVNLFTTQFTLARGYPQTATFVPEQGLDPNLDIRLIAIVPELRGYRQPTNILASEVLDAPSFSTSLGGVQTVRVTASVQGPASQLAENSFDNLTLTSSPSRSQSEIVALIGGGFIQTIGSGDSAAVGIANLAVGSPLLLGVQTAIGNALGLSEFRIFPTANTGGRSQRASALGLAAEAAVDITPSLSVAGLVFLTPRQSPQLGLRYRLNDNFLFRVSTDFSNETRAVVEYEARF